MSENVMEDFRRTIEQGRVDGDTFITPTGATVDMFQAQEDDMDLVDPGCVYCEGQGEWYEDDRSGGCYACGGTGKAGYTICRYEQRMRSWLDQIFFVDASRAEKMSYDICPDCGSGGCGGECHWTAEEYLLYTGEIEAAPITEEDIVAWTQSMNDALDQIAGSARCHPSP
jgi:hypothetical protein